MIWADMAISEDTAMALLPPGIRPAASPCVTFFIADYPHTSYGFSYHEAAVWVHAVDDSGELQHCPWMLVDDDQALVLGRELMGFPKMLGEISLHSDGQHALGRAVRKGREMLRIEGSLASDHVQPPVLFDKRVINLVGSSLVGLSYLEYGAGGERFHTCRRGQGSITVASNPMLPEIAPESPCDIWLATMDISDSRKDNPMTVGAQIEDDAWVQARYLTQTFS
ncbi:MAG: acetoacetate decarboxylase family protein [Halioglobus sp.]|nr:acetoacetate decarboxylase family protein [Halioglobus sp.]